MLRHVRLPTCSDDQLTHRTQVGMLNRNRYVEGCCGGVAEMLRHVERVARCFGNVESVEGVLWKC